MFLNVFRPSFKLAGKERDIAQVRRRHHAPATPCDRLLADSRTSANVREQVEALRADPDPFRLLADIRGGQQALFAIADRTIVAPDGPAALILVSEFLAGLRMAWQAGKIRSTAKPRLTPKRERRRPDPLVVTAEMRAWFEADTAQTGSTLLLRLQTSYPET